MSLLGKGGGLATLLQDVLPWAVGGTAPARRCFATSSSSDESSSDANEPSLGAPVKGSLAADMLALQAALRDPTAKASTDGELQALAKQLDYSLATEDQAVMDRVDAISSGMGLPRSAVLGALTAMPSEVVRTPAGQDGKQGTLTKLDVLEAAHVVFASALAEQTGEPPALADAALHARGAAALSALDRLSDVAASELSATDQTDTLDALASLHPLYAPLPRTPSGHAKKTRKSQHGVYIDGDSLSDFMLRDPDTLEAATPPGPDTAAAISAMRGRVLTQGDVDGLTATGGLKSRLQALAASRAVSLSEYVDAVVFPHLAPMPIPEGPLYNLEDAVAGDRAATTFAGRPSSAAAHATALAAVPGWRDRLDRLGAAPIDAHAVDKPIFRWSQRFVIHAGPRDYHPANRKAKLQVYLSDLADAYSLSPEAARHVAAVAGPRYNPRTGELTFSCEEYFDREDNRRRCLQWTVALLKEAHGKFPGADSDAIVPQLDDDAFHRAAGSRAAAALAARA